MNLEGLLEDGKLFFAGKRRRILTHRYKNKKEFYHEHTKKTRLVMKFFLEKEKDILKGLYKECKLDLSFDVFFDLILMISDYHDLGKINPKFQRDRIKNDEFSKVSISESKAISCNHSLVGAVFFAFYLLENFDLRKNSVLLIFVHIVLGHHSRLRSVYEAKYGVASLREDNKFADYHKTIAYMINLICENTDEDANKFKTHIRSLREIYKNNFKPELKENKNNSSISILYNYIYSILIKSDFIATSYAFDSMESLNKDLNKFYRRIDSRLLSDMKKGFDEKQKEYEKVAEESVLNSLRCEMQKKAINNLCDGLDKGKRVFYLKMPTGGGKTHASIGLILEIMKQKRGKVDRVFYSLPYMSLLEQNYDYVKDITGLDSDVLKTIYSLSDLPSDENEKELERFLTYDDFFEYPFIFTTHVSLFNAIIKFAKSNKYRLSSMANSVVVIDEVQTLPIEYWPEFNYLLNELSDKLNIYFVVMSATLPGLEKLKHTRRQKSDFEKEVCYLLKNPGFFYEKFKRNRLYDERIAEFDLEKKSDFEDFLEYVCGRCHENFAEDNFSGLIVLNSVNTSRVVFEEIKNRLGGDVEVYLLNSTLLPHKKREVICRVNSLDSGKKVVLVSTQSVEAGLDVSFSFVIRDFAILESVEQIRGRCNRNRENNQGRVYLVDVSSGGKSESEKIYPRWRLDLTRKILDEAGFGYSLGDVDRYFDETVNRINGYLKDDFKLSAAENIECFNRLKYEENDSVENKHRKVFHVDVIEGSKSQHSFFVDVCLSRGFFSEKEIDFLRKKNGLYPDIVFFDDGTVCGRGVLELMERDIEGVDGGFSYRKIQSRIFSSVVSRFVFSSYLSVDSSILDDCFERYGCYYVIGDDLVGEDEGCCYSLVKGFDKNFFDEILDDNII